jgi:flagellin
VRGEIGAIQNRFEFTKQNLATMAENTDNGRSLLMDLDVASEMTRLTSQQILVQAGVSVLAQANQMPQQLLRLFQ